MQTHCLACARQGCAALAVSHHLLCKQESMGAGCGRSLRKLIFRSVRGEGMLMGVRLSWLMPDLPAAGYEVPRSRHVCVCVHGQAKGVKSIGLAWTKSNQFQHNHVPTCSYLLDRSCLAGAGRRIPLCKVTADLPPLLSRVRLENCSKWRSIHKMQLVFVGFLAE